MKANPEKATFKTDPKVLEKIDDKCPNQDLRQRFVRRYGWIKRDS